MNMISKIFFVSLIILTSCGEIKNKLLISDNNYYLQQNNNGYGAFCGIYGTWKNLITWQTENYNGSINLEPNSFQILESI